MHSRKILTMLFIALLLITLSEIGYYVYMSLGNKSYLGNVLKFPDKGKSVPASPTPDRRFAGKLDMQQVAKSRILSEEEINSTINNPAIYADFPVKFDQTSKKIYYDVDPNMFAYTLKNSGVNFAGLMGESVFSKDMLKSIYVTYRLEGKVEHVDVNQIQWGKKVPLYIFISGAQNLVQSYEFNENFLKKSKFVKLVGGQEEPLDWSTELRDGDMIAIEEKDDLTRHPKDPDFIVEGKITKL